MTRTPQGGLKVAARLARTGVQVYNLPDGTTRREYRSPAEVFAPEVLDALRDAPVTSRHPIAGEVRADNFQALAVGHVSSDSVRAEEQTYIAANLIVQDATEIGRIERREHLEVSVGYDVTFVPGAGVSPEGEHYDGIQTQIRPNHVALVPRGRAGREVGLRLDSEGNQEPSASKKDIKMKIMIDGKEYEHGSPEAIAAAADSKRRADAQDAEIAKFRKANSAALRATAKRVKVDVRADADDSMVMQDVVKKIAPDVDLASASPEFIAGAFAVAIAIALKSMDLESPEKSDAPAPAAGAAQVRADAVDGRREDAREDDGFTAEDVLRENLEKQRAASRAGL